MMSSNKCRMCGLVNPLTEYHCRRCGSDLVRKHASPPRSPREQARRSSWLYTLLFVVLIGAVCYYLFNGFEKSYDQIKAEEINRVGTQPKVSPAPITSRSEYDQRRAEPYKNAVANSPNLAASQKHNEEVEQLMQAGGRAKK